MVSRSPFDKLRVNEARIENREDCPFVLSPSAALRTGLSKYERTLFHVNYGRAHNPPERTICPGRAPVCCRAL